MQGSESCAFPFGYAPSNCLVAGGALESPWSAFQTDASPSQLSSQTFGGASGIRTRGLKRDKLAGTAGLPYDSVNFGSPLGI